VEEIKTIMLIESNGNPRARGDNKKDGTIISSDIGLMQVNSKYQKYRFVRLVREKGRHVLDKFFSFTPDFSEPDSWWCPHNNIRVGIAIFKQYLNAGGGNVREGLCRYNTGRPCGVVAAGLRYLNRFTKALNSLAAGFA